MSVAVFNVRSCHLATNTQIHVILPEVPWGGEPRPFYESGKKYKVLWLLHGGGGDSSDWIRKSLIELFAVRRNLVVIMPSAYNSYYTDWTKFNLNMEKYFFDELMPMVYNWLPVSSQPWDNYIAGLSMGAIGAAKFVANHPECFAGAAMFSATPVNFRAEPTGIRDKNLLDQFVEANGGLDQALASSDNVWELLVRNKEKLPTMYFSCGLADEHYGQLYIKFKQYAQAEGLPFHFSETPGFDHEWLFWNQEIEKALDLFGLTNVW